MPIRVTEIYLDLDHSDDAIEREITSRLGITSTDIESFEVARRAIDARRKPRIRFVYTAMVNLKLATEELGIAKKVRLHADYIEPAGVDEFKPSGTETLEGEVLIVGAGPAGLMAALELAKNGYRPTVIERGPEVETRRGDVDKFWNGGELNSESNFVFGEGGAGAFSDGKLTHRSANPLTRKVIDALHEAGAPDDILFDAKPHIGSDLLPGVIANVREKIKELGGSFRFDTSADGFLLSNGKLELDLKSKDGSEVIKPAAVVLAPGLSARDTWRKLHQAGVDMEARPTLIGVRIEHPQALINELQYGAPSVSQKIGAADYFVKCKGVKDWRNAHSFCMCPGGVVVPVTTGGGMLSTNGMSLRSRDSGFANAALIVPVGTSDYKSDDVMAGVEFLENLEQRVFKAGGSEYDLPAQNMEDFMRAVASKKLNPAPKGTRRRSARVHELFSREIASSLRHAIKAVDKTMKGFRSRSATIYGAELRTGSPIRILRDKETGTSPSALNLYPCGEGAGYSGGIVSSAVDGLKVAGNIMKRFTPTTNG